MTLRHVLLASLLLSCAHASQPSAPATFAQFADEYFADAFAHAPSRATRVGLHDRDGSLEDLSRSAIEERIATLKREQRQLAAIRRGNLSFDDEIDAQLIDNQIASQLLDLETLRTWENNPMGYVRLPGGAIDGLMKRDFAPAPQRLRSVISRLRQVPRIYAAAKENLKNPPKEFTDLAIRMSRGSVGFFEKAVASWAKTAAQNDAQLLADFEEADKAAATAARGFSAWLQDDLLPRSHGSY
ncbi:MAG TPA: DUF885 family protein, partial [Myxococcales bacterium]